MAGDYRFPQVAYGQTIEETVDNLMGAVTILRKELQFHMNNLDSDNITNIDAGVTNVINMTSTMISGITPGAGVISTGGTYYVRTDGSDTNTGLVDSAAGAFLTIAKAVATVPDIFTGLPFNIEIRGGVYAEPVYVATKTCGGYGLVIGGNPDTNLLFPLVQRVKFELNVGKIYIENITSYTSSFSGFQVYNCDRVEAYNCDAGSTSATNDVGFNLTQANVFLDGCVALNRNIGVSAGENAKVSLRNGIITAGTYGAYASEGGFISIDNGSTIAGGTAKCLAEDGGLIVDASSGAGVMYF